MNTSRFAYSSGLEVGADLCKYHFDANAGNEANDAKTTKLMTPTTTATTKKTTTTKTTTMKTTTTSEKSTTSKEPSSQVASVKKNSATKTQNTYLNIFGLVAIFYQTRMRD